MNKYVLMHKDIPVLVVSLTEAYKIIKIEEILTEEHMPLNMQSNENKETALSDFFKHRTIPNERKNLSHILAAYDVGDALALSMKSYQLSLSDHYWIKPMQSSVSWEDVNFFTNTLTNTPVFMSEQEEEHLDINLLTPNSSANGSLRQMWVSDHEEKVLVKAGNILGLEPFNEVFVSCLLDHTPIQHVNYELTKNQYEYVSACRIFTNQDIEFIPAWSLPMQWKPKDSKYYGLITQCQQLNIPDCQKDIDTMIAIDYLILNEDRHWGNFGFLRNSSTLEFLGMAPLFDNGNSLWYNEYKINIHKPFHAYASKTFSSSHDKQIKYVQSDLSHIPINKLIDIAPALMDAIYAKNDFVTPERLTLMKNLFVERAQALEHIIIGKQNM